MMNGNSTVLGINTRTKGRGAAEENTNLSIVHILNDLLTLILILGFLNETNLLLRNTIVLDKLALDLAEDIPLARLIGTEVAEDELRTLLLIVPLIIFSNKFRTMAGLVVGIIRKKLLRDKTHI